MSLYKTKTSAPGKVILFGEHAVVYGTTAIAAALSDLRIFIDISVINIQNNEPSINVILNDIKSPIDDSLPFTKSILLSRTRELMSHNIEPMKAINPDEIIIQALKDEFSSIVPAAAQGLMAILFLTSQILPELIWHDEYMLFLDDNITQDNHSNYRSIKIEVTSIGLPIGAGLGSSAAFSVALAGALIRMRGLLFNDIEEFHSMCFDNKQINNDLDFNDMNPNDINSIDNLNNIKSIIPLTLIKIINAWSYASEVVIHGKPSGLDNTTSCYGGALKYTNKPDEGAKFENISKLPNISILLTNTKVPRSTKVLVAGVRKLYESKSNIIKPILDSIEGISQFFLEILEDLNKDIKTEHSCDLFNKEMSSLFSLNQDLLNALGVGHEVLTQVREISRRYGCESKLTGAGGGGCSLTLLPNHLENSQLEKMSNNLNEIGFETFQSEIGGDGLKIYY